MMNRNTKWKKRMAAATALTLSVSMAGVPVFAAPTTAKLYKDESVYVNLDPSGEVEDITVSNWLKNKDKEATIKDATELSKIKNVKGNETFTKDNGAIIWDAKGNDIYYQGQTKKELPVTMKITYYLDGKEISPKKLVGKSGHLKMKIEYENHTKEKVKVDGKEVEMQVPFLMLTAGFFPTDHFTNIDVDNGKVISDSSKQIVAGAVLPGMTKNLNLKEKDKIDIPEELTITADVKKFEMSPMFTVGSADAFSKLGLDKVDSLDELQENMDKLTDASLKLVDGSNQLAEGIHTLKEKSSEFAGGIAKLVEGANSLDNGAGDLSKGTTELYHYLLQVNSGSHQLAEGLRQMEQEMVKAKKQAPQVIDQIGKLDTGAMKLENGIDNYVGTVEKITNYAVQMDKKLGITGGVEEAETAIQSFAEALMQQQGVAQNGAEKANEAASAAKDAQQALEKVNSETDPEQLKEELKKITERVSEAAKEAQEAAEMAQRSAQGTKNMQDNVKSLKEAVALKTMCEMNDAIKKVAGENVNIKEVIVGLNYGGTQLKNGARELSEGTNRLYKKVQYVGGKIPVLDKGVSQLLQGSARLESGTTELSKGAKKLEEGSLALKKGTSALTNGGSQLVQGSHQLVDGIGKLSAGSDELKDGMQKFNDEGIKKLSDTVDQDGKTLVERLRRLNDLSKGYNTFSGSEKGTEGDVKFILETDAIEKK